MIVVIVVVFAIVLLGLRAIFVYFGLFGFGDPEPKAQNEKTNVEQKQETYKTTGKMSNQDLTNVKETANKMISHYINKDYSNLQQWFTLVRPYLDNPLLQQTSLETEGRPTSERVRTKLNRIVKTDCQQLELTVSCMVEVEYTSYNSQNQTMAMGENYELILDQSDSGEWKVKEMNIHGDFE